MTRCAWFTFAALVLEAAAMELGVGAPAAFAVAVSWLAGIGVTAVNTLPRPRPRPQALIGAAPSSPTPARPLLLEAAIEDAVGEAAAFRLRLWPALRAVACLRLRRQGIELDRDPTRARALLGEQEYELVSPDRPLDTDRLASGPPIEQIERLLDRLEQL
jgi:hypothetical protein